MADLMILIRARAITMIRKDRGRVNKEERRRRRMMRFRRWPSGRCVPEAYA